MKCTQVQDLLSDYSVEMLDARTHAAVESHLGGCEECRKELHVLNSVVVLVEEHGALNPPVGLFNGVRNRIEAGDFERQRPAWWMWFSTPLARASAMGLAVGALAFGILMPTGQVQDGGGWLDPHPSAGPAVTSSALASSIRQHAMSSVEGPLADRVAWEAMAQLVTQDREKTDRQRQ